MDEPRIFLCRGRTQDGLLMAVGGLYAGESDRDPETVFREEVPRFSTRGSTDGFFVDYLLAEFIRTHAPGTILVAAASIHVPGMDEGGGVIGSPAIEPASASGNLEELAPGLYCLALPGRFGAAFMCDAAQASVVAGLLTRASTATPTSLSTLLTQLEASADAYIFCADDSRSGQIGGVAVFRRPERRLALVRD